MGEKVSLGVLWRPQSREDANRTLKPLVKLARVNICILGINELKWTSPKMVNTEIRLIIFFEAKDGEALYSQQKQDQELTGPQIMDSLLPN